MLPNPQDVQKRRKQNTGHGTVYHLRKLHARYNAQSALYCTAHTVHHEEHSLVFYGC